MVYDSEREVYDFYIQFLQYFDFGVDALLGLLLLETVLNEDVHVEFVELAPLLFGVLEALVEHRLVLLLLVGVGDRHYFILV